MCCALFVFYFHYYVGVVHYLFSTLTITLVFCELFVFYFHYYVGVLRTICYLNTRVFCALFVFYSLLRGCLAHFLFSTLTITLVCFHYLFSNFFDYYVGILRIICFLVFFNYYVGVLRTICFLVFLTTTLACCALFVI